MKQVRHQQHYDQLLAEQDLTWALEWFEKQIQSHLQAIKCWPHERATFNRLIALNEQAKQRMIEKHNALQIRVSLQLSQGR
ncbi:hypothetical protein [Shewanella sp. YLB-07]|uniref:hypothetical protein n=1 Tax=Shewanella sp. YLB-07 TaxID=2601268 RepID=UPI00128E6DE4|nr:hypothetical protein [Shewanella sp. YLB-07]